jgi:hypothetical protein
MKFSVAMNNSHSPYPARRTEIARTTVRICYGRQITSTKYKRGTGSSQARLSAVTFMLYCTVPFHESQRLCVPEREQWIAGKIFLVLTVQFVVFELQILLSKQDKGHSIVQNYIQKLLLRN